MLNTDQRTSNQQHFVTVAMNEVVFLDVSQIGQFVLFCDDF